ncbi:MAG: FAD-binding protein, partial [Coriobacteriales bacterium]|nr:FAD-binding protein [Coriobacteriales bacterium]
MSDTELSRRNFLKGALTAGVAGVAGAALVGCTQEDTPAGGTGTGNTASISWDAEYDVVVLGYGGAGSNAAVSACEQGAKVLLAEKAPEGREGGNTSASGQFVMATDDAGKLYTYLTALMGKFNNWDNEAVQAFCEGCAENFEWMTGPMGGDPEIICSPERPSKGMEAFLSSSWIETENAWGLGRSGFVYHWNEFPDLEGSWNCLCLTATGTRFDRGYYNLCQEAVNARVGNGIDLWFNAPGKKLLTDAEGNVIGAVILRDGQEVKVKANGGVVLCTGGFEHNKEMIASYLQQPYVHQRGGLFNDGDGIKMAMAAGADLWHMSNSAGFSWCFQDPEMSAVGLSGPSMRLGVIVGLGG